MTDTSDERDDYGDARDDDAAPAAPPAERPLPQPPPGFPAVPPTKRVFVRKVFNSFLQLWHRQARRFFENLKFDETPVGQLVSALGALRGSSPPTIATSVSAPGGASAAPTTTPTTSTSERSKYIDEKTLSKWIGEGA